MHEPLMSVRGSKVLIVASAITLIWGSEKRVVAGEAVSELKTPVDLSQQVLTEPAAINRTVKVPLRDRSIALHVYLPKQVTAAAPLILFASGSGGWHQFDAYVATALAQRGMPVCGINTHAYLKAFYTTSRPATVDELISDYSDIIKEAKKVAGVEDNRPVILSGWSLGAGYAQLNTSKAHTRCRWQSFNPTTIDYLPQSRQVGFSHRQARKLLQRFAYSTSRPQVATRSRAGDVNLIARSRKRLPGSMVFSCGRGQALATA
jgi:predicted dienelactone hydrolase